jgi:hypothetical protein
MFVVRTREPATMVKTVFPPAEEVEKAMAAATLDPDGARTACVTVTISYVTQPAVQEWLDEHCRGRWKVCDAPGDPDTGHIAFADENDAFAFKVRWG